MNNSSRAVLAVLTATTVYTIAAYAAPPASPWETVLWEKNDHAVQIYRPSIVTQGQLGEPGYHVQGTMRSMSQNPAVVSGMISDGKGNQIPLAGVDGKPPADTTTSQFDMDCDASKVVVSHTRFTRKGVDAYPVVEGPSAPIKVNGLHMNDDWPAIYHVVCE